MGKNTKLWFYSSIMAISLLIITHGCSKDDDNNSLTDIDGNIYTSVTIGTQEWMVENLKVTHFRNGDPISNITDNAEWSNLATPGYCWYNNDQAAYKNPYGALYNWYAINSGDLCPSGWHLPTEAELTILNDYLGGENIAGGKLKETGNAHWASPNSGATNESGFTALPGGCRIDVNGLFIDLAHGGYYWSSTQYNASDARYHYLNSDDAVCHLTYGGKTAGHSVRCLKD